MNIFGKVAEEFCFVLRLRAKNALSAQDLVIFGHKTYLNRLKRAIPSSSCSSFVNKYEFTHKYQVKL